MNPDRFFSPDPSTRAAARELYESAADLPIVSPHGHVDPALFSDPQASFGSPADLFVRPDHYVTRMLHSQGIPPEALLEGDDRETWRIFCGNFRLFRGTPSGIWLRHELSQVFGLDEEPAPSNSDTLYDRIAEALASPEFTPRRLFERFNIEVLCTTDAAGVPLDHHEAVRRSGWTGRILPTFRPDGVLNLDAPRWGEQIERLGRACGATIVDYPTFLRALEARREAFRGMGAVAADHAALTPETAELSPAQAGAIFQRALKQSLRPGDSEAFTAHMLMEMARMSLEDGLVMQLHVGSQRNHDRALFERFGPDRGADIPIQVEFTRSLSPLLNKYGTDARLSLILFTLDESAYTRELAPLAGHYPALKLGPPWWFLDSLNGMRRYFDGVMETAGLYNTAGFNDDTRAFCSIPARHDLWRRASADWLAGLVVRHVVDMAAAREMMRELAVGLARRAYRLK